MEFEPKILYLVVYCVFLQQEMTYSYRRGISYALISTTPSTIISHTSSIRISHFLLQKYTKNDQI
jgi:hypothetical protein